MVISGTALIRHYRTKAMTGQHIYIDLLTVISLIEAFPLENAPHGQKVQGC